MTVLRQIRRLQTGLTTEPASQRNFRQGTTMICPLQHPHQVQLLNVSVSARRKVVRKPQPSPRAKKPKSKSSTSTSTFDITLTRNRWRRHRAKRSSKTRRLGEIGRIDLESIYYIEKANELDNASTDTSLTSEETQQERSDRISKLEREYFGSTSYLLGIDFETATLEEKYEAMLLSAFSTRDDEDEYR
mmetsp:Transcript_13132/g.21810  ORF Transcript_13132/g.21810 Transcript_13132/m.21810 type:complete len:189 (-) Transcript_13132:185-751(-)